MNAGTVELALGTDRRGRRSCVMRRRRGCAVEGGECGREGRDDQQCDGRGCFDGAFCAGGGRGPYCGGAWRRAYALRRVSATGVVNTSSGDSLVAHFRPVTAGAGRGAGVASKGRQGKTDGPGGEGADEISGASEQGHVVMTQMPVRKPGDAAAPAEERVTAERAVYDGELERTTLTGMCR